MNMTRSVCCTLGLLAGLAGHPWVQAQQPDAAAAPASAPAAAAPLPNPEQYSPKGADTCLGCHDDESSSYSAAALFQSKHGQRGNKRSPFGANGLQCEACHGPGALHARNRKAGSINTFKPDSKDTLEARNQTCLGCHDGSSRTGWHCCLARRA